MINITLERIKRSAELFAPAKKRLRAYMLKSQGTSLRMVVAYGIADNPPYNSSVRIGIGIIEGHTMREPSRSLIIKRMKRYLLRKFKPLRRQIKQSTTGAVHKDF